MTDPIPCPYGSVGPRALVSLPTSTTASEEQGDGAGGVYVFVAVGADVSIAFGPAGAVATPTPAVGYQVRVGDAHVAMRLPSGTRFRAVSASAGTLVWYRSQLFDARDPTATFYGLPWHTLIVPSVGVTLDGGAVSKITPMGSAGVAYSSALAAYRPTLGTGAHGKPVLVFDGVDNAILSASNITMPKNYVTWAVLRVTSVPPLGAYVWTARDGGTWSEQIRFTSGARWAAIVGGADTIYSSNGQVDTSIVALSSVVRAYPGTGELRKNNASLGPTTAGSDLSPVVGITSIGGDTNAPPMRPAPMELSAFGILDADELGADLEATLATLQAYAELQWGV